MTNTFYFDLVDNLYEGVYFVDKNQVITTWNKRAEAITGYKRDEVVGSQCSDNILRHLDKFNNEICISGCPLHQTLTDGKLREAELFLHHKDGHRVPVKIRISPMYDENNTICGASEIFFDLSKTLDIITLYSNTTSIDLRDTLTGLGNSLMLEMYYNKVKTSIDLDGLMYGYILCDIDDLNTINTIHGKDFGTKCIEIVAKNLKNLIREFDIAFRIDGGTFIVIVENITFDELEFISERIRFFTEKSWMSAYDSSIFYFSLSAGACMVSKHATQEETHNCATALLRQSKAKGKNTITCSK
ncbi:MAG: hypothetical protein A2015_13790 [Spirochaetes bacterium GWF1_31_7]|nr:MAG: hypothetical protein A2Y30_11035 [Spirochaetes bacterium GWE1_32_154]OHD46169.1 MAG: hypothetical protein A2Y29_08585 [Spirochaetes bacterium GWE2_31_10]OHD49917.1 MAG: hypothetical protein A2015_13790 [Spirochaetes bacterium GWF1_31_7]OHD78902.1 MAG: hypothetical protein A2355_01550 [Spirochaetes bacterium RIFOXYB1_FULL_32_8]